jgi:hypothetical protein
MKWIDLNLDLAIELKVCPKLNALKNLMIELDDKIINFVISTYTGKLCKRIAVCFRWTNNDVLNFL